MKEPHRHVILLNEEAFALRREETAEGARFILTGDVDAEGGRCLLRALEADGTAGGEAEFCLGEAEIVDGKAVAEMVDAIRLLGGRFGRIRIFRSPQILAHTLYRAGMLGAGSRYLLVEPREEEGSPS